jgi:hypothetical protein
VRVENRQPTPEPGRDLRSRAAATIAGTFALAAFAVAIVAGLASGNNASVVLIRAILAMTICYPVGLAIGLVTQRVIQDHIDAHREAHPAPASEDDDADDETSQASSTPREMMGV